jgi:hypothetical protein
VRFLGILGFYVCPVVLVICLITTTIKQRKRR